MQPPGAIAAILFDRDGTLIHDEPYNGDPDLVRPMPGAAEAVQRARSAGLKVGIVSNQSGVGRGLITQEQVDAVNARVDELLGPFDVIVTCPHTAEQGCECRKPEPGMIRWAAAGLGMATSRVVVIGDIGSDVEAGLRAGALAILVPTPRTLPQELAEAPIVVDTLSRAVGLVLSMPLAAAVA
jgi:HAD superfamily hydrolase (TIGR01662 family)